jgi:hypothetical protein
MSVSRQQYTQPGFEVPTKSAAILCPGPSLSRTYSGQPADLLIGVNRAALAYGCDVWAALDYTSDGKGVQPGGIIRWRKDVIGNPVLLTTRTSLAALARRGEPWGGQAVTVEEFAGFVPLQIGWTLYSMTAAVVYAAWRGAKRIDLYGCDWAGTADHDGVMAGGNRSAERWSSERTICESKLFPALKERGIEVTRHV